MDRNRFSKFVTNRLPIQYWDVVHNVIGVPVSEILFVMYCISKNNTGRGDRLLRYSNLIHKYTQVVEPYNYRDFKKCL